MEPSTNGSSRVSEDVGEVTHLHRAVRKGEEAFKALANSVPCIVLTLAPNGLPEFVNDRWIELTGQTPQAARARPGAWLAALHPADRERLTGLKADRRPGAWSVDTDVRIRRASDGAFRRHSLRISPISDDDQVVALVAVLAEADDSIRQPTEARERERALRYADDIATLARNIREALAPIASATWLLRRPEQAVQKRASDVIERQVQRMVRVLEDFEAQLQEPASEGGEEAADAAALPTPAPMRVLLVARTIAPAQCVTLLLTASGHATQVVRDLSQAIAMSRTLNPHIVMVEMDSLGEGAGDEIRRLREEEFLPRATYVALASPEGRRTASACPGSRMTCFDYELTMPVSLTEIERMLAASRARDRFR